MKLDMAKATVRGNIGKEGHLSKDNYLKAKGTFIKSNKSRHLSEGERAIIRNERGTCQIKRGLRKGHSECKKGTY